MLNLTGRGSAHTCDGVTRRDFLQAGSLGAVGLSMADLAAMEAQAAVDGKKSGKGDRSVIMIFNLGAPSQLDTWDPKPNRPFENRGPFGTIPTKLPKILLTSSTTSKMNVAASLLVQKTIDFKSDSKLNLSEYAK